MRILVKINDFLRTGLFGTVKIGDTRDSVVAALGEPEGAMNLSHPYTGIHYSMYEFHFENDRLFYIQNDHYNPKCPAAAEFSNQKIEIDPGIMRGDKLKTLREIESILKAEQIEYTFKEYWGRKVIQTSAGIVIDFNDEKWDDAAEAQIKIAELGDHELIGIRSM